MCGIFGKISFDLKGDKDCYDNLITIMHHRGPDANGIRYFNKGFFLHNRLKIIDLSDRGNQPICNEDEKIWLVANGEIYNYEILKKQLIEKGHKFKSDTDIEVILHLYEEDEENFINKLDGMFAFAIWDSKRERLLLARDYAGIKPLFYYFKNNLIIFSSEIKPIIMQKIVDKSLDFKSLSLYFKFNYIPHPYTPFKYIKQLSPSKYLLFDRNGLRIEKYCSLNFNGRKYFGSEKEIEEKFYYILDESVKKRMMSDVPFGVFLSGGLDSSSIAYFLRKNYSGKLDAFTVGFEDKSYDELEYAKETAKMLNLNHNYIVIKNKISVDDVIYFIEKTGELFADSSFLPFFRLSKIAKNNVKMVLSGDGGDEVLGGYETYQAFYLWKVYQNIPKFIRNGIIKRIVNNIKPKYERLTLEHKLKRFVANADRSYDEAHILWREILKDDDLKHLLKQDVYKLIDLNEKINELKKYFGNSKDVLNAIMEYDFKLYLPSDMLVKVDRASMLNSLEVRVPFLDRKLVEFLAQLPSSFKIRHFINKKFLLKKIMKNKIQKKIIKGEKKGFNLPVNIFFRDAFDAVTKDIFSKGNIERTGVLEYDFVDKILTEHREMKKDWGYQLWGIMVFIIWYNKYYIKN